MGIVNLKEMPLICESGALQRYANMQEVRSRFVDKKERKFYLFSFNNSQRICVNMWPNDNPGAMGMEKWHVPSGKYEKKKIKDADIMKIRMAFNEMGKKFSEDKSRPRVAELGKGGSTLFFPVTQGK